MRSQSRTRAFTLVELLVVIGIVALLISVLLPVIGRARAAANATVCMSNLRELGTAYLMYCQAHKGTSMQIMNYTWAIPWAEKLDPYMRRQVNKFRLCPSSYDDANRKDATGTAYYAWNWSHGDGPVSGSYGLNLGVASDDVDVWGLLKTERFAKVTTKAKADRVPLFGDCNWQLQVCRSTDATPPYGQYQKGGWSVGGYCLDRHNRAINMGFRDGSVKRVRFPELWLFSWTTDSKPRDVRMQFPPAYR
jgi:general secretion pathway protein G